MGVLVKFPLTQSSDTQLEILARLIATFNIEDYFPDRLLIEFEQLLARSSYREIVVSAAPARMRAAAADKDSAAYYRAYDDLITMCDALKRAFPTPH